MKPVLRTTDQNRDPASQKRKIAQVNGTKKKRKSSSGSGVLSVEGLPLLAVLQLDVVVSQGRVYCSADWYKEQVKLYQNRAWPEWSLQTCNAFGCIEAGAQPSHPEGEKEIDLVSMFHMRNALKITSAKKLDVGVSLDKIKRVIKQLTRLIDGHPDHSNFTIRTDGRVFAKESWVGEQVVYFSDNIKLWAARTYLAVATKTSGAIAGHTLFDFKGHPLQEVSCSGLIWMAVTLLSACGYNDEQAQLIKLIQEHPDVMVILSSQYLGKVLELEGLARTNKIKFICQVLHCASVHEKIYKPAPKDCEITGEQVRCFIELAGESLDVEAKARLKLLFVDFDLKSKHVIAEPGAPRLPDGCAFNDISYIGSGCGWRYSASGVVMFFVKPDDLGTSSRESVLPALDEAALDRFF